MTYTPDEIWDVIIAEYDQNRITTALSLYGLICVIRAFAIGNDDITHDKKSIANLGRRVCNRLLSGPLLQTDCTSILDEIDSESDAVRNMIALQPYLQSKFIYYYASASLGLLQYIETSSKSVAFRVKRKTLANTAINRLQRDILQMSQAIHNPSSEAMERWIKDGREQPQESIQETIMLMTVVDMIDMEAAIFSSPQEDFHQALFKYIENSDHRWAHELHRLKLKQNYLLK